MDPNVNIQRQRELVAQIIALGDRDSDHLDANELADLQAAALELAELVLALDEWRLSGGFDPYTQGATT